MKSLFWINSDIHNETLIKLNVAEENIFKRKNEYIELQSQYDTAKFQQEQSTSLLTKESDLLKSERAESLEKKVLLDSKNAEIEKVNKENITLNDLLQRSNLLRILQARYGIDQNYIDVTGEIKALIKNGSNILVSNETLGGKDPVHGKVKQLFVVYESDGEVKTIEASEGTLIHFFRNNLFEVGLNKIADENAHIQNAIKLSKIFPGEWELHYVNAAKDSIVSSEKAIIDETGRYFKDGHHLFNLVAIIINSDQIHFTKMTLSNNVHSKEHLRILSNRFIVGVDSLNFRLEYDKI
ncbi:MAG: hypothetical protein ABIP51_11485 [Bacteroidia bacterium]